MPFKSLPVVHWDGEAVGQSLTQARYVAKKVGLAGDNDEEVARSEAMSDFAAEVLASKFLMLVVIVRYQTIP